MGRAGRLAGLLAGAAALAGGVAHGAPDALESYAVGVAPLAPNRVVVFSLERSGVGHWVTASADGGATWSAPVGGPSPFAAAQKAVVLGNGAFLFVVGEDGRGYRSVDGGATWRRTLSTKLRITQIAADVARLSYAWAMSEDGALFRSVNAAVTWRRSLPLRAGCHGVATQPRTRVVLATCPPWIWRSVNGGATWRAHGPTRFPLPPFIRVWPEFESAVFDPTRPAVVIANAYRSLSNRAQIWRSVNAGRTWKQVRVPVVSRKAPGFPAPPLGALRVTAGAGKIIAGPYWSGDTRVILASADGGVTWAVEPLDSSLPGLFPGRAAVPDPTGAGGSAGALFMPVRRGAGQVLAFRPGSAGWAATSYFTPPPPEGPL